MLKPSGWSRPWWTPLRFGSDRALSLAFALYSTGIMTGQRAQPDRSRRARHLPRDRTDNGARQSRHHQLQPATGTHVPVMCS